jgi:N-acyl amino acid synthase of PEP-CTERM/exosortase system
MFSYGGFRFQVATDSGMIRACQSLRYQIYVEECGFERPEDHRGGLETDCFDDTAIHVACVLDDRVVGTTRLVLNGPEGLPIFHVLKRTEAFNPRSTRLAEVSRLAVDPSFRQCSVEALRARSDGAIRFPAAVSGGLASQDRRNQSVITMGLIQLCFSISLRIGVNQWLMICEKKLWLMLKRAGIVFRQVGEGVDYHGLRIPYLADAGDIGGDILRIHNKTRAGLSARAAMELAAAP